MVQDNVAILSTYKTSRGAFSGDTLDRFYQNMDFITKRGSSLNIARPLTLEEFDDKFQSAEPVYGLCRDAVNKRITIAFRGTDSSLAFCSNWRSNLQIRKKRGGIPECLKHELEGDKLSFHSGFYSKFTK